MSLIGVKEIFLSLGVLDYKDGNQIKFWEDTWLGNHPLKIQYTTLYNIAHSKDAW